MALSYRTDLRNARLQAVADDIDSGSSAGVVRIYSGSAPANVGASLGAAELLAEIEMSSPPEDDITGGVLTFDAFESEASIVASGTATFFRMISDGGSGNAVVQGTVSASSGDMVLDSVAFVLGGTVTLTSGAFTAGNA